MIQRYLSCERYFHLSNKSTIVLDCIDKWLLHSTSQNVYMHSYKRRFYYKEVKANGNSGLLLNNLYQIKKNDTMINSLYILIQIDSKMSSFETKWVNRPLIICCNTLRGPFWGVFFWKGIEFLASVLRYANKEVGPKLQRV